MCGQGGLAGADLSLDLRTKESLGMKAFGGQPWGLLFLFWVCYRCHVVAAGRQGPAVGMGHVSPLTSHLSSHWGPQESTKHMTF